MSLTSFFFLRPLWLFLLPVAVWLWWQVKTSRDPLAAWRSVMDGTLLSALTVGETARSQTTACGLLCGWTFAVVALAGPTWRPEPSPFADDPAPVLIVFKAGESMSLSDVQPSRLERAQLKVADFAAARAGKPTGLIAYAGSSHLVLPPTRDTSVVATMAAELSPDVMPKSGDDLSAALELAGDTLGDQRGVAVVVADSVTASDEAMQAVPAGVDVTVLGIVRSETPEATELEEFAKSIRANFVPMTADSADIDQLTRLTSQQPRAIADPNEGTHWEEAGWWLTPFIALLALASFRRENDATPQESVA